MLNALKSQLGRLLHKSEPTHEKGPASSKARRAQRSSGVPAAEERLNQMREDLYKLLGQHPSSRRLMRHLAMVERALEAEGVEGLEAVEMRVLARALNELEKLVWDWSPAGLAELRSRMAVIVKTHQRAMPEVVHEQTRPMAADSDFLPNARADVSEATHAEFEEMERSWAGVVPPQKPAHQETADA